MAAQRNHSRRVRGTGSIKKRTLADGVTRRYDAIYRDVSGQQISSTHPSRAEAEQHLRRALGERLDRESEANDRAVGRRSFRYYAERFLNQKRAKGALKPTTERDYHSIIWGHLIPWFGDGAVRISALTIESVEEYIVEKLAGNPEIRVRTARRGFDELGSLREVKPLKAYTVRNHLAVLQAICSLAVNDDVLVRNPVIGVERPKVKKRKPVVVGEDEMRKLVDEFNPEWRSLAAVLCYSGLRLGEARALKWRDLDEPGRLINVREASSRGGAPDEPKSAAGVRAVAVRPELFKYLRAHKRETRGGTRPDDYIFASERGILVSPDNFRSRHFRPAVKRAGLPKDLRIHDLRHSFCCALIAKNTGADKLKDIQRTMGHSNIQITLDIYTHVVPGSSELIPV